MPCVRTVVAISQMIIVTNDNNFSCQLIVDANVPNDMIIQILYDYMGIKLDLIAINAEISIQFDKKCVQKNML